MNYAGDLVSNLVSMADNAISRIERVCMACGEKFGVHCGWDERCPDPRSHELNQPFFIDGQHFTLVANRCTCTVVQNCEDCYGVICGKRCEAGKTLCHEHYEE